MTITITITENENMYGKITEMEKTENGYKKVIELSGQANAYVIDRLIRMIAKADTLYPSDVINRRDCIATTIWTNDDIAAKLEEKGYEPSDENIAAVISTGALKNLGDCLDYHWGTIDNAIAEAMQSTEPHTFDELKDILQSVVDEKKDRSLDLDVTEKELLEMGFNYKQLEYFGYYEECEDAPRDFEDTYRQSDSERAAALKLLTRVVAWFKSKCADLEILRRVFNRIGFSDDLLSMCNF